MTFGEHMRMIRKAKGMTLRTLAEAVGVDFTYLSKLENDRLPPPSERTIWLMAETLDADPSALFISARKVPRSLKGMLADAPPEAVELLALLASKPLTVDQYQRMLTIARVEQ